MDQVTLNAVLTAAGVAVGVAGIGLPLWIRSRDRHAKRDQRMDDLLAKHENVTGQLAVLLAWMQATQREERERLRGYKGGKR
jgi:hypothetical protein